MKVQYNKLPITVANQGITQAQCDVDGDLLVTDAASYMNITTNTLVKTGPGFVMGVIINNHTAGTLRLWDNTSAAVTPIGGVITFSAVATTGERFIPFWGARFTTGLYASVSSADLTIIYN
jgi:hypothetical protein